MRLFQIDITNKGKQIWSKDMGNEFFIFICTSDQLLRMHLKVH